MLPLMKKFSKLLFLLTVASFSATYRFVIETKAPKAVFDRREINHSSHYGLHIIVVVYNRYKSLLRLLESINSAEYYSDKIKLQVWIDRSVNGTFCPLTLQTAQNFTFNFGDYEIKIHPHHVGLYGQWLTTWVPSSGSRDIAVILEDDAVVSKYYYGYLKLVHRKYDHVPEINGYSLQGGMRKLSVGSRSRLSGPASSIVFLYPSMGPWGFSPNNRNWRQFLNWFVSPEGFNKTKPYVPGNAATYMYKAYERYGKTHTMWTIWHRYYAWKNNEYTLFCNFYGHAGLTANWRERGLHFGNKGKLSNPLLTRWFRKYERLPNTVPRLDLAGNVLNTSTHTGKNPKKE